MKTIRVSTYNSRGKKTEKTAILQRLLLRERTVRFTDFIGSEKEPCQSAFRRSPFG